jgi:hypothetical protein
MMTRWAASSAVGGREISELCNSYSDIPTSSTVRYLGIEVDDAIEIAEKIDN